MPIAARSLQRCSRRWRGHAAPRVARISCARRSSTPERFVRPLGAWPDVHGGHDSLGGRWGIVALSRGGNGEVRVCSRVTSLLLPEHAATAQWDRECPNRPHPVGQRWSYRSACHPCNDALTLSGQVPEGSRMGEDEWLRPKRRLCRLPEPPCARDPFCFSYPHPLSL
jgi:hypothetical protein